MNNLKVTSRKLLIILLGLVFLVSFVSAIPQTFNIHGKLTDSGGSALDGTYGFNFSIYDAYTSGNLLWNSGNVSVTTDSSGIYNLILVEIDLSFSEQYYLGVAVGGDSEMSPRINLTSSPYAFRAQNISVSGVEFDSNVNIGGYDFIVNNSDFFVDVSAGFVGIGTTGPSVPLEVVGRGRMSIVQVGTTATMNDLTGVAATLQFGNSVMTTPVASSADTYIYKTTSVAGSYPFTDGNSGTLVLQGRSSGASGDITFLTGDSGVNKMVIKNSGNVGIGTTSPSTKLEVNGSVNISGSGAALIFPDGTNMTSAVSSNAGTLDGYDSTYFMPLNKSVSGDFDFNGGWQSGGLSIVGGDIYAQKGWFYDISSLSVTHLNVNGSLLPSLGDQFDVGNSTLRWKGVYAGTGSFSGALASTTLDTGQGAQELYGRATDLVAGTGIGGGGDNTLYGPDGDVTLTVAGGTCITADADGVSVTANSIDDAQIFDNGLDATSLAADSVADSELMNSGTWTTTAALDITGANIVDGFGVDGTTFSVDALNNRVGIGTTTPGYPLDILRTTDGTVFNVLNSYGTYTGIVANIKTSMASSINFDFLRLVANDVTQVRFRGDGQITTTGNVGIGTTEPGAKLDIIQTGESLAFSVREDAAGFENIRIYAADGPTNYAANYNAYILEVGTRVGGGVYRSLATQGQTVLATSVGNVGIGTTAPSGTLEVVHTATTLNYWEGKGLQIRETGTTSDSGILAFQRSTGEMYLGSGNDNADSFFILGTRLSSAGNRVDAISIRGSGNVGIGTTSPNAKLQVVGDLNVSGSSSELFVEGTGNSSIAGNLGIGTAAPAHKLDVNGSTTWDDTARFVSTGTSSGLELYTNTTTRNGVLYGAGANFGLLSADTGWVVRVSDTDAQIYHPLTATTITASGVVTGSSFTGAGTGLTGTAASLSIGGNAATATNAVHVTDASQPAITSVGTLTGLSISGAINRTAAGTGYLDGGYAGVETTATSGAIYSIGGSYVPGTSTLGNMYGIGYGYSGGGGIGFTGVPNNLWGMYVASGGVDSIFLSSGDGTIYSSALVASGAITAATIDTGAGAKEIGDSVGNCASTDVHKGDGGCEAESGLSVSYADTAGGAPPTGAASGDLAGTYPSPTIAANAVALTTDTTGNYAAGTAEAGAALTGDSATAFFSTGTLEDARLETTIDRTIFNAADYITALGGIHVGGTSDPGTDNLYVDGVVGIGITPGSYKLSVQATSNVLHVCDSDDCGTNWAGFSGGGNGFRSYGNTYGLYGGDLDSGGGGYVGYGAYGGYFTGDGYFSGNVGIGTTGPDHDLEIGTGTYSEIDAGEATFTTGSSRTYKENINPVFVDDILNKISKIPVTTYDFKPELCNESDDKCKNKIGLIAEDFHVIFERGDEKQLSGDEVRMALWLAVQELNIGMNEKDAEIEELKQRISALENK